MVKRDVDLVVLNDAMALRRVGYQADVEDCILPPFLSEYDVLSTWTDFSPQARMSIEHARKEGLRTVFRFGGRLVVRGRAPSRARIVVT